MRVDHILQLQPEVLEEVCVALSVLDDRINEDTLLGVVVGQEVRVGAGLSVKQLPEELIPWRHGGESSDTLEIHRQLIAKEQF